MGTTAAKSLIMVLVILWFPVAQAGDRPVDEKAASTIESTPVPEAAAPTAAPHEGKGKDLSAFWIVLVLSILFVLGSALALNALGGKHPPPMSGKGKRNETGGEDQQK